MSLREIPAAKWPEFLQDFTRGHRAWLATVDRTPPGAPVRVEAIERPLRSVTPEMSARDVVAIEIRFQQDSHIPDAIRVDAPTRIRVNETMEGTAQGLEIQDEHGDCTRVRFRAAPAAEMLDGIAPGELPTT
jgi:hypothetical protein